MPTEFACARCGGHRKQRGRGADRFCSNECVFDHWASIGAYPKSRNPNGVSQRRAELSPGQLARNRQALLRLSLRNAPNAPVAA